MGGGEGGIGKKGDRRKEGRKGEKGDGKGERMGEWVGNRNGVMKGQRG